MEMIDPGQLTPVFYSEISSSYLLRELLNGDYPATNHNSIDFLSFVHIKYPGFFDPAGFYLADQVRREYPYRGKGSIDLHLRLRNSRGQKAIVLIEVKVHDYLSATPHQITTYMQAALDEARGDECQVFFIYLTQFTRSFFNNKEGYNWPGSIAEFDRAKSQYGNAVAHISWLDLYEFLATLPAERLNNTVRHLLDLQQTWMMNKIDDDLKDNRIIPASRAFEHYFPTTKQRIGELKPLGLEITKSASGEELRIKLAELAAEDYKLVFDVIRNYADGPDTKKSKSVTEPKTIEAAQGFLQRLATKEESWPLLSFYAELFHYASNSHLNLCGTGTRGLSIRVTTNKGDNISLCTIWKNDNMTFRLSR